MAQYASIASPDYRPGDALYEADRELEALYAALSGRGRFSYEPGRDPLYQAAVDRYVQNGRMAMRDSMGQAAALTGGYGSSYAQAVGQQQYDEYLRSLSQALPELYQMAWQQYSREGEALEAAYDRAAQRRQDVLQDRESAYQRQRDELADARYQAQQEAAAAQAAYKQQQDALKQQQTAYGNLVKLISGSGYSPSDGELQAAGLSRAQAEALRQAYLRDKGLLPASTGGGGGGGGGGQSQSSPSAKSSRAAAAGITGANAKAVTQSRAASGSPGKTASSAGSSTPQPIVGGGKFSSRAPR